MTTAEIKKELTIDATIAAFGVAIGMVGAAAFHSHFMVMASIGCAIAALRLQRYARKL